MKLFVKESSRRLGIGASNPANAVVEWAIRMRMRSGRLRGLRAAMLQKGRRGYDAYSV
jgi:hypothetical protein